MQELGTYLIFDGNCRQAMEFYAKCFNAELHVMKFGEGPMECPEGAKDKIMHARLTSGKVTLMASDNVSGPFTQGNNFSISIDCESAQEADRLFAAIGERGKVTMPMQETFWAARFGMLTDQFGINWMFNLNKPQQ